MICQNCEGRGKYYSIEDEYFRYCRYCKGTGEIFYEWLGSLVDFRAK